MSDLFHEIVVPFFLIKGFKWGKQAVLLNWILLGDATQLQKWGIRFFRLTAISKKRSAFENPSFHQLFVKWLKRKNLRTA
jgi:hypothetical protein